MTTAARTYSTRTVLESRTDSRDTAHQDARGRHIGARCLIETVRYDAAPEGQRWGYDGAKVGVTEYAYTPQATRNGEKYGALQSTVAFPTAEERDAAVERYFEAFAKRTARKFPNA